VERVNASQRPPASKFRRLAITHALMMGGDAAMVVALADSLFFDIDLDAAKAEFVFAGDSPNDSPMFGFFPNGVGVANVRDFEDRLAARPAYVTPSRCGAGFVELADALIAARGAV